MKLRRLIWRTLRFMSYVAWSSPLAKNPFWAETFVRIGYTLRRRLGLSPRGNEVASVHGNKMIFGAASELYFDMTNDNYEPGVTGLFDILIKPGMTVVDIGAHIGYYTLVSARKTGPAGKVYTFEPDPSNYEVLVKNIAINEYRNVIPVQKAICDTQGTATFYLHMDTVAHSLHPTTMGRGKTTTTVETTSLDYFFEHEGWPPVHLIKMDIEGAELAALVGMTKLIERNPKIYLLLEFVPQIQRNVGVNPRDLIEKIRGLGFTIQVITENGIRPLEDKMCDNLSLHTDLFCEKQP